MAVYQNNMRYNRMGSGCQMQRQNYNNRMSSREDYSNTREGNRSTRERCSDASEDRQSEECCRQECPKEFPGFPIGMAYVPWQSWCEIYDISKGFHRGTIFRELDMPFLGKGGCNQ